MSPLRRWRLRRQAVRDARRIVADAERDWAALQAAMWMAGDPMPRLPDVLEPVASALVCRACLAARADGRMVDVCGRCAPVLVG